MGNAAGGAAPAAHDPPASLRLKRGKKTSGSPCCLADRAATWEAVTNHPHFRSYVLRNILDERFLCSILEEGDAGSACEGVVYFKYMEEGQQDHLRKKIKAWQQASGAGVTESEGLNAESAFGELQLARPPHAYGFLPILQRRVAVLRELGSSIVEERRLRCRPYRIRARALPPRTASAENADVHLALAMNEVSIQSLTTLTDLVPTLLAMGASLPSGGGGKSMEIVRAPFQLLANMLGDFPHLSLFKYWSPMPAEPEKGVPVKPQTATASSSPALAHLAVTGGALVAWKASSSTTGDITWQVELDFPTANLTSVVVQWGIGDEYGRADKYVTPMKLQIEASVDGGKEWHSITGGDGVVDAAVGAISSASSCHRYPVSLASLCGARHSLSGQGRPLVTHVRLTMGGRPSHMGGGVLRIYDVAINASDACARTLDVMKILRKVQDFLLQQQSLPMSGLMGDILRAMLGICQGSGALEFELDLVNVLMDIEDAGLPSCEMVWATEGSEAEGAGVCLLDSQTSQTSQASLTGYSSTDGLGEVLFSTKDKKGLQGFLSKLVSAAMQAKRLLSWQGERLVPDACFDKKKSSATVEIGTGGMVATSVASYNCHALLHQCLQHGVWTWVMGLECERHHNEMTCLGVAVHPVTNSLYQTSREMWMVRCFSGETYCMGTCQSTTTCKIHPGDCVRFTLDCDAGTLALEVNGVDQGVVFNNVPAHVHPAVNFYGSDRSVRLVYLKQINHEVDRKVDSDARESTPILEKEQGGEQEETQEQKQEKEKGKGKEDEARNEGLKAQGASCGMGREQSKLSNLKLRHVEEEALLEAVRTTSLASPSAALLSSLALLAQQYIPCEGGHLSPSGSIVWQQGSKRDSERRPMHDWEGRGGGRIQGLSGAGEHSSRASIAGGVISDPREAAAQMIEVHFADVLQRLRNTGTGSSSRRVAMRAVEEIFMPRRHSGMGSASTRSSTSGSSDAHGHQGGRVNSRNQSYATQGFSLAAESVVEDKALPLEEPYAIEPTAAVFSKLHALLVRSLDRVCCGQVSSDHETVLSSPGGSRLPQQAALNVAVTPPQHKLSAVLYVLRIIRVNFCRLVEAHVHPSEVGLTVKGIGVRTEVEDGVKGSAKGKKSEDKTGGDKYQHLLPDMLSCLQDVMLQEQGNPDLMCAAVETFSDGLPLLMPLVKDRLHFVLALVRHMQRTHRRRGGGDTGGVAGTVQGGRDVRGARSIDNAVEQLVPPEQTTLLQNLIRHFARTEIVLEVLRLFKENESERKPVRDLLELMVFSIADSEEANLSSARAIPRNANSVESLSSSLQRLKVHQATSSTERGSTGEDCPNPQNAAVGAGGWLPDFGSASSGVASETPVGCREVVSELGFSLLIKCQQHLVLLVLESRLMEDNPCEVLLCQYGRCLLKVCCSVLPLYSDGVGGSVHTSNLIGVLLPPFLHGLFLCANRPRVAEAILPAVVHLLRALSKHFASDPAETDEVSQAEANLQQVQLAHMPRPEDTLSLGPFCWRQIPASFQADEGTSGNYIISEDGKLCTAITNSESCAMVDVAISHGTTAWEFLLESDTASDECSVFGIATKPLRSRCYSTSSSLWMRRSYTGTLYERGRPLPDSRAMPKICTGDVVRCVLNMDEGTLRFSVNGEEEEGGFDGLKGVMYPCAASYRGGVAIRLLKVEVKVEVALQGAVGQAVKANRDPSQISWAPAPCAKITAGGQASIDKNAMSMRRMSTPLALLKSWSVKSRRRDSHIDSAWIGQEEGEGEDDGQHSFVDAAMAAMATDSAGNSTSGGDRGERMVDRERDLPGEDRAGGGFAGFPERPLGPGAQITPGVESKTPAMTPAIDNLRDLYDWDWVTVVASRGLVGIHGRHAVEIEVTMTRSGGTEGGTGADNGTNPDGKGLRGHPMAFGLCKGPSVQVPDDLPVGGFAGSWAWWSDGTLRAHGQCLYPEDAPDAPAGKETIFGASFLPLQPLDVITVVTDISLGTIQFLVNGADAGIAFGPLGSGAICELPAHLAPCAKEAKDLNTGVLFPSCSMSSSEQVVILRPAGTCGTQKWPLTLDLEKTVASLTGRLCATMIAGNPQDESEMALEPWLSSPLLSGGIEASQDIMSNSDWHYQSQCSWEKAWSGEPTGDLSWPGDLMWGIGDSNLPFPEAPHTKGNVGVGRTMSLVSRSGKGQAQLVARVCKARGIPRGFVMWREDPTIRLSLVVDGEVTDQWITVVSAMNGEDLEARADEAMSRDGGAGVNGDSDGRNQKDRKHHCFSLPEGYTPGGLVTGGRPSVVLQIFVEIGGCIVGSGKVGLDEVQGPQAQVASVENVVDLEEGGQVVLSLRFVSLGPALDGQGDRTHATHCPPMQTIVGEGSGPDICRGARGYHMEKGDGDKILTNDNDRGECVEAETPAAVLNGFLVKIASWPQGQVAAGGGQAPPAASLCGVDAGGAGESRALCPFSKLLQWMEQAHRDPVPLRRVFEKMGNYSFPSTEAPFVGALLKHSGLAGEAFQAVEALGEAGIKMDISAAPPPSPDMAKLWGRVRQLRLFLRTQKQQFKVMSAGDLPSSWDSGATLGQSGAEACGACETKHEEKEGEQREEVKEGWVKDKHKHDMDHRGRSVGNKTSPSPVTFEHLCEQIADRARFLLELAPWTIGSPESAAESTSVLMHHLAEDISDLPTPPPPGLRAHLLRWRSEDHGNERWKGVVDVLRVRSQLRRSSSYPHRHPHRQRAKSWGSKPHGINTEGLLEDVEHMSRGQSRSLVAEGSDAVKGSDSPISRQTVPKLAWEEQAGEDHLSGEESDSSEEGSLLQGVTAATAAMQAVTIYTITGGTGASPERLKGALKNRTIRAAMRRFGLKALACLIRMLSFDGNSTEINLSPRAQSAVQEALVFLQPAFRGLRCKSSKGGEMMSEEVEVTEDDHDKRHHYLKGLKGCSADQLLGVQSAFEDLYSLLSALLGHSFRTREPTLAHVLMTTWVLDFESRDYHFLARQSCILPTLQEMITITKAGSMAHEHLGELRESGEGDLGGNYCHTTNKGATAHMCKEDGVSWMPWSLEGIREGFLQGTLLVRGLAQHIISIPVSAIPGGTLKELQLDGSVADIVGRHSMGSLLRAYSSFLRFFANHTDRRRVQLEAAAELKRTMLKEAECKCVEELIVRGVPVLDNREKGRAKEVLVSELCTVATVPQVHSVACVFARGVQYTCSERLERGVVSGAPTPGPTLAETGNYFEVLVINPGEKTTIGVGLADPDHFQPVKNMPGWVDHSYGYHGDDGRKFGQGSTGGNWTTWLDGDVIGCGYSDERAAIWYTLNGELLGDGFTGIHESKLVPVIGFNSNGESVRVNFGVSPFVYKGPEVVVSTAVLAERHALQLQAQHRVLKAVVGNMEGESGEDEEKTENLLIEEKVPETQDLGNTHILKGGPLLKTKEVNEGISEHPVAPGALEPTLKLLRQGACSLLRFLIAVSVRQTPAASLADSTSHPVQPEDSRSGHGGGFTFGGTTHTTDLGTGTGARSMPLPPPPTRERSIYGTPLRLMQTHADSLHQDLFDLILRELRLGAMCLGHIVSRSRGGLHGLWGSAEHKESSINKEKPSNLFPTEQGMRTGELERFGFMDTMDSSKQDIMPLAGPVYLKRSYSDGYYPNTGDYGWHGGGGVRECGVSWMGNEEENLGTAGLGLMFPEVGEVEPALHGHLLVLLSVRHHAVTKTQLSHPSAIGSMLNLLRVGSPRMQRCILLLLGHVLPGVEPQAVDGCLPEAWRHLSEREQEISNGAGHQPENRRPPSVSGVHSNGATSNDGLTGLVGVLLMAVRRAYAVPPPPRQENLVTPPSSKPGSSASWNVRDGKGAVLAPGCGEGFGGGLADLCLADQCAGLLRELYKDPAWKELIARTLLVCIRNASNAIHEQSVYHGDRPLEADKEGSPSTQDTTGLTGHAMEEILCNAIAALAIITGSSGMLYPGVRVRSKSGALGSVVQFSAGDSDAGVIFTGENMEGYEMVPVHDLEAVDVGLRSDPDTSAQPILSQLISLLSTLLTSDNNLSERGKQVSEMTMRGEPLVRNELARVCVGCYSPTLSRLLSLALAALQHLAVHCTESVVAACQEEVVASILPALLRLATQSVPLPALVTVKDMQSRWRITQCRGLSALHVGSYGLCSLQAVKRCSLPKQKTTKAVQRMSSSSKESAPEPRDDHSASNQNTSIFSDTEQRDRLLRESRRLYPSPQDPRERERLEVGRAVRQRLANHGRGTWNEWAVVTGPRGDDWAMVNEDLDAPDNGLAAMRVGRDTVGTGTPQRLQELRAIGCLQERDVGLHSNSGIVSARSRSGARLGFCRTQEIEGHVHAEDRTLGGWSERGGESDSESSREDEEPPQEFPSEVSGGMCITATESKGVGVSLGDQHGASIGYGVPYIEGGRQAPLVSHILEYSPEAIAEREIEATALAQEMGIFVGDARAVVEAFATNAQARQWLNENKESFRSDECPDNGFQGAIYGGCPIGKPIKVGPQVAFVSGAESDVEVVAGLIGSPGGQEATSGTAGGGVKPDTSDHGQNLWDGDDNAIETTSQNTWSLTKRMAALCDHDLEPILAVPQMNNGPKGLVDGSLLVNEADLIVPGTIVILSTGEGYAPQALGPCGTVADEIIPQLKEDVAGLGQSRTGSALLTGGRLYPNIAMEDEEVLVELLDAETGLCLGMRVPVAELRYSRSLFGEPLDSQGRAVTKVLCDTDRALCVLRARRLLVRFIHLLQLPAVTAAGGPHSLLSLTRLLAAEEMAKGEAPASLWRKCQGEGQESGGKLHGMSSSERQTHSTGKSGQGKNHPVDATPTDSLLKVLWHKVIDSNDPASPLVEGSELGDVLAREVMDAFETLSAPPQTMMSGGRRGSCPEGVEESDASLAPHQHSSSRRVGSGVGHVEGALQRGSIVHESLHPLLAPLSYAGHLTIDPTSQGMVVKMDSRSSTLSSLLCLQFFSTKQDMLQKHNPIRTMYGRNGERAAHAMSKGLEFFKIEEANSLTPEMYDTSNKFITPSVGLLQSPGTQSGLIQETSYSSGTTYGTSPRQSPASSNMSSRAASMATALAKAMSRGRGRLPQAPLSLAGSFERDSQSSDFRSFSLPGITELWFRFDAPPGADKPPLRMRVLAGALHAPLSTSSSTGPFRVSLRDSGDEALDIGPGVEDDFSQEDLGLKSLFSVSEDQGGDETTTDNGEEPAALPSLDRASSKGSESWSGARDPEQGGCLLAAEGVHLTSGRWFYEAAVLSVESPPYPMAASGGCDSGLLRVGWTDTSLTRHTVKELCKLNKLSKSKGLVSTSNQGLGHDSGVRAGSGRGLGVETSTPAQRPPDRGGVGGPFDSVMHTTELKEGTRQRSQDVGGSSDRQHTSDTLTQSPIPGSGVSQEGYGHSSVSNSGMDKAEVSAGGILFPVLGSDPKELGWGIGEEGYLWSGNQPKNRSRHRLVPGDIVGCAVDLDESSLSFSVNGKWMEPTPAHSLAQTPKGQQEDSDQGKWIEKLRAFCPCLSICGGTSVRVNFGGEPFAFPPPDSSFQPVILRDVTTSGDNSEPGAFGVASPPSQTGDSESKDGQERTGIHTPTSHQRIGGGSDIKDSNWGFRFVAEPLQGVQFRVVRELDLVCRLGVPSRSASASEMLSIWRPKAPNGWFSVGDVARLGSLPPPGAVVIRGDNTGCVVSKPAKFRVVYQDKESGYNIWRPVPRQGQRALGDFACAKKASKIGMMSGAVRCVAAWAVEPCPVLHCLWRDGMQSGTQAIWSVQNGLGTFFGSQTGGRLGKREIASGSGSRDERRKRNKKKKKKKMIKGNHSQGDGDSSGDEGRERIKSRHGVGQGWALRGVSASCISNEWCQEADLTQSCSEPTPCITDKAPSALEGKSYEEEAGQGLPGKSSSEKGARGGKGEITKIGPSVSWASWLLSFLLDHPGLCQLAMRSSVFRTMVSYLRSRGAPQRIQMVPLLTQIVRSHEEFKDRSPPLQELSGFLGAVLSKCDQYCSGEGRVELGTRHLEVRWAPKGLLLLTDLVTATRSAEDSLRQQLLQPRLGTEEKEQTDRSSSGLKKEETKWHGAKIDQAETCGDFPVVSGSEKVVLGLDKGGEVPVKICLPRFGAHERERQVLLRGGGGDEGETDEGGSRLGSRAGSRSIEFSRCPAGALLCPEERTLLEEDLERAALPEVGEFREEILPFFGELVDRVKGGEGKEGEGKEGEGKEGEGKGGEGKRGKTLLREVPPPSPCLNYLLEIMHTLKVLRGTWPIPPTTSLIRGGTSGTEELSGSKATATMYLDSLLCEAWMDAVGPAMVRESAHPFRHGLTEETLHFPGAHEISVYLEPRCSMPEESAVLTLEGGGKTVCLTGRDESTWDKVIRFTGDSLLYRFKAREGDGRVKDPAEEEPDIEDWGYRFTAVAEGPVWEAARFESDHPYCPDSKATGGGAGKEVEFSVPGALSLLVEFDKECAMPEGHDLAVYRLKPSGEAVQVGLLSDLPPNMPLYIKGETVRVVPMVTNPEAGTQPSKLNLGPLESARQHAGAAAECTVSNPMAAELVAESKDSQLDCTGERRLGTDKDRVKDGVARGLTLGVPGLGVTEGCSGHGNPNPTLGADPPPLEAFPSSETAGKTMHEEFILEDESNVEDVDVKLEHLPSTAPVLSNRGGGIGLENVYPSSHDLGISGVNEVPFGGGVTGTEEAGSDADCKEDRSSNSAVSCNSTLWVQDWRQEALTNMLPSGGSLLSSVASGHSVGTQSAAVGSSHTGNVELRSSDMINTPQSPPTLDPGVSFTDESCTDTDARAPGTSMGPDQLLNQAQNEEKKEDLVQVELGAQDLEAGGGNGEECSVSKPGMPWGWGFSVCATAMTRLARLRLYLARQRMLPLPGPSLEEARDMMSKWTSQMDASLLDLMGISAAKAFEGTSSGTASTFNWWCCRLSKAQACFLQQCLSTVSSQSMQIRAALLLRLNDRIQRVLGVIDLASKQEDSIGWQVREMNHVVLPYVKGGILEDALHATQGSGGECILVTLDNVKALASREKEERDLASSQCVFVQAYNQLKSKDPQQLRTVWDGDRVFQVTFVGEEGVDAGGVFREGVSRMVEDLFSPNFDLLIQCPNGRQATGQNNEKYVPNPQHTFPLALSMFQFMGRLMGVSLRTRLCLPFELPGMIWKSILGLRIGFEDLRMVDTITCQFLTAIRDCEDDGLNSEVEFREKYGEHLFFTCTGSDGVERELSPGGASRRVTFDNRGLFCDMVEHARLHEFDAQVAAIARGLAEVVPMKVLRLFTGKQLEVEVAGEPVFDITFWKEHTEYKGFRAEDPTIVLMWKVIESLSPEDQSGFVRFAWGRSRLPPRAYWHTNMKISNRGNATLPVSHTCFFSVELPEYKTEQEMRKGLLTAIHFGGGGILNA